MSEVYTRTTSQSLGSNLVESIKSFFIGVLLFLGSFGLLYWNEGRTDMSEVAKRATIVKADSPGTTGEGKLISATADLKVDEAVGDPEMLVPGQYVKLHRKVEMYAWTEKYEKKVDKKVGGGSVTTEKVTYDKKWVENPPNSDSFKVPKGHWNPKPDVQSQDFYATKAKVGSFSFSPKESESTGQLEGGGLPPSTDVPLTAAMVKFGHGSPGPKAPPAKPGPVTKPGAKPAPTGSAHAAPSASASASASPDDEEAAPPPNGPFKLVTGFMFRGRGTPDEGGAKLGDMRVSFQAVLPGKQVTLFGKRTGTEVTTYVTSDGDKLLRAVIGTHEQAISTMHGEHVMLTWILRLVGFLCMWIGMGMILSPINAVLDIVPFIGSAGRFITSVAMFPIALVLSIITIFVSIVAHSPILLILILLLTVGGVTALVMVKKKKAPPPQAAPAGGMPPMGYQGGPPQGGAPPGYGGPPQGGYGPPPGGGGYGPPPGGGGYGPPPGGGGYGPPPGGGAPPGYGGPPQGGAPPGYGGPPQGGAPPGYGGPPQGGGGYGGPPQGGG